MIGVSFLLLGLLYVLTATLVLIGLYRRWPKITSEPLKSASVIICARDEETDLPACLESLEAQVLDSSTQPLDVILVDDASRDRTAELMEAYARTSRHQVQVLHLPPPRPDDPSGKWRPLKEGLRLARNDGLLLTDADAVLPQSWVMGHLRQLKSYEISAGFVWVTGSRLWDRVQRLDWQFLLSVGSSLARWGWPQSAFGKNLALRRSEYLAVGGLESVGFSITEDLALVQLMVKHGGTMRFSLDRGLMVSTPAAPTWADFTRQRKRWTSGIWHLQISGQALLAVTGLRNFAVVLGVLSGQPSAFLIWGITAVLDFFIQARLTSALGLRRQLFYFPLWELFYTWTTPILAVAYLFNPQVGWKGRQFTGSNKSLPLS